MKNFVVGLLVGIALMLSFGASAEIRTFVGKQIEGAFPVEVNGTTLASEAIVVEGTSFAPLREISELFGSEVSFIESKIKITTQDAGGEKMDREAAKEVRIKQIEKDREESLKRLEEKKLGEEKENSEEALRERSLIRINGRMSTLVVLIQSLRGAINGATQDHELYQIWIKTLADHEAELADLERQKAELQP